MAISTAFFLSSLSKCPAIVSPSMPKYGVMAMEITTTPTRSLASTSGNTCSLSASVRTTNANSPPPDRSKPVRMLSALDNPKKGPKVDIITALNVTSPASRASTVGHCSVMTPGSTDAPVVKKKSPSNKPRKGLMSDSI